jgi:hypothetical protein
VTCLGILVENQDQTAVQHKAPIFAQV